LAGIFKKSSETLMIRNICSSNKLFAMRDVLCKACYQSIANEPCIWPYFGLANSRNHGSHPDMDYSLMLKSAEAIIPYFYSCFMVGLNSNLNNQEKIYASKQIGLNAETAMYKATNNINTHKGTIFILCILSISLGSFFTDHRNYSEISLIGFTDKLLEIANSLYNGYVKDNISKLGAGFSQTYGEWAYCTYGILGIRSLVTSNFKLLKSSILLFWICTQNQNVNLVLSHLRLYYLAYSEDTNIIKRAGINTAFKLQGYAQFALSKGGMFSSKGVLMVRELDQLMLKNNWSAAASGDLMISLLFLVNIYESIYKYDCTGYFKV
jgi:triphosphoribosyl-dephospho-CoA synthase